MHRSCTQTAFVSKVNMWLSVVPVLAVFCQISTASVILDKGSPEFHSHFQRRAEFGESIREWFNNMKNRLIGRSSLPPAIPDSQEFLDMNKAELMQRMDHPGNFFVDVSHLTFDPEFDWGFHVGPWFFIRRGERNYDSYDEDSTKWNYSPSVDHDESHDTSEESNEGQNEGHDEGNIAETTTPEPEIMTTEGKREEENETGSEFTFTDSAEVLTGS